MALAILTPPGGFRRKFVDNEWSPQCPKGYTDSGELFNGDRLCSKNDVDCGDDDDYDDDGENGLPDCPIRAL